MRRWTDKHIVTRLTAMLLVATGWTTVAVAGEAGAVNATLAADGRTFTLTAPGLTDCRGSFSATVLVGTNKQVLSAANGVLVGRPENVMEVTPLGTAAVTAVTFHFEEEHVELLFRLGRLAGVPGLLAQAGIRNFGPQPTNLVAVTPVALEFAVDGPASAWLVTALDRAAATTPAVVALDEIQQPLDIHEYGGFYRIDGAGFLFGPVGTPIAYGNARITRGGDGRVSFSYGADMSGVQVAAGETRWGQQVVLLMESPPLALARWAEWVAKTHGARTALGALTGWSSWYFLGRQVTGQDVLDVAEQVLQAPDRLRPEVIQIDEGYQGRAGQRETNEKFPQGLASYAQRIAATGARPGLKLNFKISPSMTTNQWQQAEGFQAVQQAVQNGFTYLKLNVSGSPFRPGEVRKQTAFEVVRENYTRLRAAAGDQTYLLESHHPPDRAVVGLVDASRIGLNISRHNLPATMADVLCSYPLNGRWFAVDNDAYFMGTDVQNVSKITGGWPLVRTWLSLVGLSCGAAITSDPWYWDSFKPYWRNVEVLTPPAREHTDVLDLCTRREWPRLVGHVHRDWGDFTVALLWNPGATEQAIKLDFAQAGLDPHRRYAVWSFWDNRCLGVAQGSWTTPRLGPSASQHLRFTELDRPSAQPVLIGSNLHIYCGAAEIKRVTSSRRALVIELTDAGARAGDLFVYSRFQPVLRAATGCAVTGIGTAGENVWRISLQDRRRGRPQQIAMALVLPVTYQVWFWLLIATVIASLVFAAWRYVAGLHWQRAHALAQERGRIAQDLHDDLGANLAEIAMISELAQDELPADDPARVHFNDIFTRAEDNVRRLGEIVWAINPANDTLERFAGYLCKFAQDYLTLAKVRCRLDLPETLPSIPLNSIQRHNLFLAAKEAIHNAVRHGAPSEVILRLTVRDGRIVVTIEDNGRGFDPTLSSVPARGSANMCARLEHIGGTFACRSALGQGTTITLTVSITPPIGAP